MGNYLAIKTENKTVDNVNAASYITEESDDDSEYESCIDDDILISSETTLPAGAYKASGGKHLISQHHPSSLQNFQNSVVSPNVSDQILEKLTRNEHLSSEQNDCLQINSVSLEDDHIKDTKDVQLLLGNANETQLLLSNEVSDSDFTKMANGIMPDKKISPVAAFVKTENTSLAWEVTFSNFPAKSSSHATKVIERLKTSNQKKSKKDVHFFRYEHPVISNLDIAARKVLDVRRWHCMCRPQYKKSCGISSLVSVWNFLYATTGTGSLNPVTQEEALNILGFKPPFDEIRFGPFTGNATLIRWFRQLNTHFGVKGKAYYLYKPKGRFQTKLMTEPVALNYLKQGLRSEDTAFVYHCYNHYFCPVGYEMTPHKPTDAYAKHTAIEESHEQARGNEHDLQLPSIEAYETWILIGEPSKCHPPIHCKRWTEIVQDLMTEGPSFYDIRRPEKGVQEKQSKKKGGNLHCLLAFKKIL